MRLHVQVELLGGEVAPQLQREHRLRGRGVVQLELQLRLVDVEGAAVPVQIQSSASKSSIRRLGLLLVESGYYCFHI